MPWVGDRQIHEQNAQEAARTYVDVLSSKPNCWGRNLHPIYGDSSNVRYLMTSAFGSANFDKAVDQELVERREGRLKEIAC